MLAMIILMKYPILLFALSPLKKMRKHNPSETKNKQVFETHHSYLQL